MSFAASARRMLLGLLLTLGLALAVAAQETGTAAGLGDVTLTDGRTFKSVVVVSQSATALNVRHAGGLTKLDKRLLPPELQARFPVDAALAAKEEQDAAAARERAAQEKQRKAAAERARLVSEKAAKQAGVGAANQANLPAVLTGAGMVNLTTDQDRAAHAPHGLFILRWVQGSGYVDVTVRNPTITSQKFDFRLLQGLILDNGSTVAPQDVRFKATEVATYWLDGAQERTFKVIFPTQARLAAISWTGTEEWRLTSGLNSPIAANKDAAIRQTHEVAAANQAASRARSSEYSAAQAQRDQEKTLIGK